MGALAATAALPRISQAAEVAQGVDPVKKTITIGAFTPISGPVPFYALLTRAAQAYFRSLNEAGGIGGWKINFITYDDGYDPGRSVAVTRRLVEEDKIFALVAPVGTAQTAAVIPYAKQVGLPIIGPVGGATAFFSEPLVFPLLPDYGWSAAANVDFARTSLKLERIALLWENDELGRSAKRGIDILAQSQKFTLVESMPFEVTSTDLSAQIRRIANAKADAIVLFGSNANLASALKAADRSGVTATWFAPFFAADPTTYRLAGPLLEKVYFSSWLLPVTSDETDIKAYRQAVAKYFPNDPLGVFGLNGWSNAALFGTALKMLVATGMPVTRANLLKTMQSMTDQAVGGARRVSFSPTDHRGTRQEAIIQASGGGFKLVRDFAPYPAAVFNAPNTAGA
jgi:ABC-type branched-subunit amino acid transport system substrate-binding protein